MAKKITKKKKEEKKRTPIIAVMGHVDHGKTSLLDAIRNTRVQQGEAGGITQMVRTHQIEYKGSKLTFIDTPGHEAFTSMREKGAMVTDMVLLVVAADDGVKPQTVESIKYAQKYKLPIVVAINKIDIEGSKVDKIRQELASANVLLEDWGGDVLSVKVSATEKTNIDKLMEAILLQAELMDLKKLKPKDSDGEGIILESSLDNSLGPVALALVKKGEISNGQFVVHKQKVYKIRSLFNDKKVAIKIADPGSPIIISGLSEQCSLGEIIKTYSDEEKANESIQIELEGQDNDIPESEKLDLEALFEQNAIQEEEDKKKKLPLIIRADTLGSIEAITQELKKLSDNEISIKIIKCEPGDITKSDIMDAKNTKAIIVGFNSTISPSLKVIAKREKVLVKNYTIIYELIDEIDNVLTMLVSPEKQEVVTGVAKVKKVFILSDKTIIAGCVVEDGSIKRSANVYITRKNERIGEGNISSLRREKDEIKEALKGTECGIRISPQIEIKVGDKISAFKMEKILS